MDIVNDGWVIGTMVAPVDHDVTAAQTQAVAGGFTVLFHCTFRKRSVEIMLTFCFICGAVLFPGLFYTFIKLLKARVGLSSDADACSVSERLAASSLFQKPLRYSIWCFKLV